MTQIPLVARASAGADDLVARVPPSLAPLARLAYNYWWSWAPGGPDAFRAIDPRRWETCGGNPVRLIQEVSPFRLADAGRDGEIVQRAQALEEALEAELARPFSESWPHPDRPIAFFCAEYGIHSSLPTYAGGLGVLAGDIVKAASDEAVPMVAVGLLYRQGYFHQQLDTSGWQREHWVETDPERLPATLVTGTDGRAISVTVEISGHLVAVQVWRVDVGRVPLFLLDTDRPENSRADRWITSRVYVGDWRVRLAQYAVLGVGGVRALRSMGVEPGVVHLNEGHAALAPLELARERVARGASFEEAIAWAKERTVFTTHTPVAAGNEAYMAEDFIEVLGSYPGELGVEVEQVLRLGRSRPDDPGEAFGLTPLGVRMSRTANGVSRVHGRTARTMWQELFPGRDADDVPIGHVTNGVHLPSWMALPMRRLLDQHLGEGWPARATDQAVWDGLDSITDRELWAVRGELRASLVDYVRTQSVEDRLSRGEPGDYAMAAARAFRPDVLTVGFARRAAGYKRFSLLLHDRERLLQLLTGERPIQLVLAGKSHPQDEEAKRILQSVFGLKWASPEADSVVFLEDYDIGMAKHLVAGCDVWLNVPRAPLEASGTSGMKAALGGALNLSVLDGWWEEAFDGTNGWAIASDAGVEASAQDAADAEAMYSLMETQVVPLFYERDRDGLPVGWLRLVRSSLRTVGARFTAARMLRDYLATAYRRE